ncbi:MAG TPA: PilZ domain-containing protein [Kineosporiaceae bacterium]|nr:PilZ domain-containing protein [Kineosporiaceae bacterium]
MSATGPDLASGDEISLLPVTGGRLMRGTVVEIMAAVDGAAVRVELLPRAGSWMHGVRTWVIRGPGDRGTMAVYEGRLRVQGTSRWPELVELNLLADESRRAALRAAARHPMLLVRPGKVSRATESLDLSSTGCRVTVPDGQELAAGQVVQVAVDLDAGSSVWAEAQVVWSDGDTRTAALRFTRVDPADQERLDRGVLAALATRSPRGS